MSDLNTLLSTEIPEGLQSLANSHINLERVAEYCESNYFQVDNKKEAIDETKRYTTQSLASVAYQVNTLAYHFLQLLDLQTSQLDEMAAQASHIAQSIAIHKEKVSRREIGVLTSSKTPSRQYKILAPATPEKPVKYVRKPIDYSLLDEIGYGSINRNKQLANMNNMGMGVPRNSLKNSTMQANMQMMANMPPNSKPPTPPMGKMGGTLRSMSSSGSGNSNTIYSSRTPAIAPPQIPAHYAPNYPMGHPRRTSQSSLNNNGADGRNSNTNSTISIGGHSHHSSGSMNLNNMSMQQHMMMQQNEQRGYTTLPLQTSHPQQQVTQSQIPLASSGIPFRQRDIQPMSHQQIIYAENKSLGIPTGPSSPPLPPPPIDMQSLPEPPPMDNPMIPKAYLEKVIAVYDYAAERDDELSFQENSLIYVLKKNDDGWWEGVLNGRTGLFPGNYVEPCV